jgi:uncharacterized protein (UPF0264 family)
VQLLVSVANAEEAHAALGGGADIVDAKDPAAGPLGAVSMDVLRQIESVVRARRPLTAAVGDATSARAMEEVSAAFAEGGASYVKVGFAGIQTIAAVTDLLTAAVRGARRGNPATRVVAVGYADADRARSLDCHAVARAAIAARVAGVLVDTFDKTGPGLMDLMPPRELAGWVSEVQQSGLFAALAGRLSQDGVETALGVGADIAGVRGAACDGGRTGIVSATRVSSLRLRCRAALPLGR